MGLFDDLQNTKKGGRRVSGGSHSGKLKNTDDKRTEKPRGGRKKENIPYKEKKHRITKIDAFPAGDVVTAAGGRADLFPASVDDVGRLLPAWVSEWIENNNIQNIRKESPQIFRALCLYIGKTYIKPSKVLKDKNKVAAGACVASTCNRYDPRAVLSLWDVFESLAASCNKTPFQTDFAAFCGVSIMYIRDYVGYLTSSGLNIAQKTHDAEIDAIRRAVSVNPVGGIAILNNEHYGGGVSDVSERTQVIENIPNASGFSLIDKQKLD